MGTAELTHQKQMRLLSEGGITMRKIIAQRLSSFYVDVPSLRPGTVGAYALALVAVGVATVLRLALDPFVVGVRSLRSFPQL
jgi:hypothetical protein